MQPSRSPRRLQSDPALPREDSKEWRPDPPRSCLAATPAAWLGAGALEISARRSAHGRKSMKPADGGTPQVLGTAWDLRERGLQRVVFPVGANQPALVFFEVPNVSCVRVDVQERARISGPLLLQSFLVDYVGGTLGPKA